MILANAPPKTGALMLGLGVLLLITALVIGFLALGNPYFAAIEIALFVYVVALVALRLTECFRLARGTDSVAKLQGITFFLVLAVIPVLSHLIDIFQAQDTDYVQMTLNVCLYFALMFSLELVAALLKKTAGRDLSADLPQGTTE